MKLVWFRNDLRVADNPALHDACSEGPVEAVFLMAFEQWRDHDVGELRVDFLLRSLQCLAADLATLGIPLHLVDASTFSQAPEALHQLCQARGAEALYLNAEYPLNERRRDTAVAERLQASGVRCLVKHGTVLRPPGELRTGADKPYTVFTPFRKRWYDGLPADAFEPLAAPEPVGPPVIAAEIEVAAASAADDTFWKAGEAQAQRVLARFIRKRREGYAEQRDFPGENGTSVLSPYLAVGAISPRQCAAALARLEDPRASQWMTELIWREFYRHVVYSFDHVSRGQAFRREYDAMAWERDEAGYAAWQAGRTGYPLVDAGMRQLAATGWMHNRVRMVTAMFLSKHLLLDWRLGERHFMQQLVDGDFASNNGGWQWSASTGTDAAPYFRIFNPTTQGKRFDPDGKYVRRWVPELKDVPDRHLFEPHAWQALPDYPPPIVEHAFARQRAIERFKAL